jgi:outer membrane protein OmpA-like peptidoglycan-associated protein
VAAPNAPGPVKPATAVASTVAAKTPLLPKPTIVSTAPAIASPTPVVSPTTRPDAAPVVAIASPIAAAAAKVEIARKHAEQAIEDALAHFAFDSAEITEAGRAILDAWLAKTPGALPIQVTGHADRLGPEPYNEKLSLRRAEAVKKYLTEKGKPANHIQILAKGEALPVVRCAGDAIPATKECLAPNRRAEIIVKPAVAKPAVKIASRPVAKSAVKPIAKPINPKLTQ